MQQTDQFFEETNVLNFSHARDAVACGDQQLKGFEQAKRYYHIRTPLTLGCCVMYRFHLTGYAYGAGHNMDSVWCGYLYSGHTKDKQIWRNHEQDLSPITGVTVSQYVGSDKHLYLKYGPVNRYCNAFSLKYQGHYSKATLGGNKSGYSVKVTVEDAKY